MSKFDLYPNPAFVEAVRKDGYNEFGFDVFLMARYIDRTEIDDEEFRKKQKAYKFIEISIEITDKERDTLEYHIKYDTSLYKEYKNTIEYLLKYYDFILKEGIAKNLQGDIGASYDGGIVIDYIEAVNSKEAVLYTKKDAPRRPVQKGKWPNEMSSWFPETQLLYDYTDYPPMLKFGGPEQRWKSWYFNLILVSVYRDKGFDYESQKMFMNWKGNPLNR